MEAKYREEDVSVIATDHGKPIVTFEDQAKMGQGYIMNGRGPKEQRNDFGFRKLNPDGSVAASYYENKAVNTGWFFDNRYRMVGKKIQVVIAQTSEGYRAISDLKSGQIFKKHIVAYEFERKNGDLVLTNRVLVSDQDFITYFTNKLDEEAMKVILPLIPSGAPSAPEGKLPI